MLGVRAARGRCSLVDTPKNPNIFTLFWSLRLPSRSSELSLLLLYPPIYSFRSVKNRCSSSFFECLLPNILDPPYPQQSISRTKTLICQMQMFSLNFKSSSLPRTLNHFRIHNLKNRLGCYRTTIIVVWQRISSIYRLGAISPISTLVVTTKWCLNVEISIRL